MTPATSAPWRQRQEVIVLGRWKENPRGPLLQTWGRHCVSNSETSWLYLCPPWTYIYKQNKAQVYGGGKKQSEAALSPARGAPCTLTSGFTQAYSCLCLFCLRQGDLLNLCRCQAFCWVCVSQISFSCSDGQKLSDWKSQMIVRLESCTF